MTIDNLAAKVRGGGRLDRAEALELYLARARRRCSAGWPTASAVASTPDGIVTYIIDRNVNYTNVCVARCNFCAFYRPVGSAEGYVLGFEEIFKKIDETIALGGGQLLLQGGHNPDLPLAWYEDLFRAVKKRYPTFRLHALSPPEVIHLSRLSRLTVPQVIERLVAAGLDSIPGGGAEILVDRVRKLLNCYSKATADEWLDVMRQAHRAGLRTTATMMYGTVESPEERLEHLLRLRELQDEDCNGGFTAFITWSYQPDHTELGGAEATGVEYLRTLAIARLVLDNFDNLQASWVTQGGKVGQLSLAFGANDMGSVMIEENVVRAAGASYCMDEIEIVRNIENAGFVPKRRNMHYELQGDPFFREQSVPRMLELAVARADGDTVAAAGDRPLCREKRRREEGAPHRPLILYHAAWVLPIAARPLRRGWVLTGRGRVVACGNGETPAFGDGTPVEITDLGEAVILPGLVNAHTHLELSWLRDRVPPGGPMPTWASRLLAVRREAASDPPGPIGEAIGEARAAGTSLVGDVTNTLAAYDLLADSALGGAVFRELIGFNAEQPEQLVANSQAQLDALMPRARLRPSIVPHAPYSVSPALFRAIARAAGDRPVSVHLAESAEEIQFLRDGTGAWRELLGRLGVWNDRWEPPACGPVEYLDRLGLVTARLLAVHGTQLGDAELAHLARAGATVVACARSNRWTGAGIPPIERFYASGVRVAIGTDSLASVEDLNLFTELAELRRLAPGVPAARSDRERHVTGGRRAWTGGGVRNSPAGNACRPDRRPDARGRRGCGRIPADWNRARCNQMARVGRFTGGSYGEPRTWLRRTQ